MIKYYQVDDDGRITRLRRECPMPVSGKKMDILRVTGELTRDYIDLWCWSLYGYAQRPAVLRSLSCYLCKSAISLLYFVVLIHPLEAR